MIAWADPRTPLEQAVEQLEPAAADWSGVLDEKTVFSIAISLRRIADMMAADRDDRARPRGLTDAWPDQFDRIASEHSETVLHPIMDEGNSL